jgi:thiol-disulfide isomerase/thioredoxin
MVLYPDVTRRAALGGLLAAGASRAFGAERDNPPAFETERRQFTQLRPARSVPPTRLVGLDGRAADLVAQLGKVTLVNFWASWCPACRTELPILERLHVTMADQGVRVVAISMDRDGRNAALPFLRKLNIRRLPVYLDAEGLVAYADRDNHRNAPFALYGMPISYVIDREHRIVGYLKGEADWTSPAARDLLAYYAA